VVVGLTVVGFVVAFMLAERGAHRDAEHRAEVAAAEIDDRVGQAVSLTESLRRFMLEAGGTGVTRAQFSRNGFGWLSPAGFPAAAWVERVPASRREAYERRIGQPIVSPGARHDVLPAVSRSSYLPATLVSGFPPMSDAGIDLSREPGMAAALARATRLNRVTATASVGDVAGTRGLFLVAPAPNLIDRVLRPGYVVLFVPDAMLRAAADTPNVQLTVGRATAPEPSGRQTFAKPFEQASQRFDVAVSRQSLQASAGLVPWIILGGGLVLAGFAAALGLNAGRRAQAQDELDRIFHLSSDLIAIADLEGRFKRVNPAFERTLGYSGDELRSRPYVEFVHPDDRARTLEVADALAHGREVIEFENRYLRKDGAVRWLQWSARAAPGEAVIFAAARDVTERKQLEEEQAALRHVATLVARGTRPEPLFRAVADEVGALIGCDTAAIVRFEADGWATVMGGHLARRPTGDRFEPEAGYVVASVRSTGHAARFDTDDPSASGMPDAVRAEGIRSGIAAPIVVDDELWGTITVASLHGSLPASTEQRLADFTDLVGTAIANAESRAELFASRSRIVTTADQTRRRIERDLHDGAQQRLVTLTMKLRSLEAEPATDVLGRDLEEIAAGLDDVLDDLRETARGLHPVMLSRGGLGPALKALGRRSPVPVELDVRSEQRLPEPVEVAAYYVVAEALTNAAKHAQASLVSVEADVLDGDLHVSIQDDGVGGANPAGGSGLVGLADRVEALGGRLALHSPPGGGTTLRIDLPL
jgi:PAS domain S-box-containing protein